MAGLLWPIALALLALAWFIDDPYLFAQRDWIWAVVLLAALLGVAASRRRRALLALFCAIPLVLAGVKGAAVLRAQRISALRATAAQDIGRHFVVGYVRVAEVEPLAAHGLIGGVFVTRQNIAQGAAMLRAEIAHLQRLRKEAGLPPLIVTTDQESGLVSHLSPPLPKHPPLAEFAEAPNGEARAKNLGATIGAELADLGITMDFAPVVDLRPAESAGALDFHSFIARRAISADPEKVTRIAGAFSQGLVEAGVTPVLKHFPGLGRISEDTHHFRAHSKASQQELAESDWRPFRALAGGAAIMVGHVVVDALDAKPASQSRAVVGLLRRDWGFENLVVTDDLNMSPVFHHDICHGVVESLNAGVDLLLVAYDGRQYFPLMDCALQAEAKGEIDAAALAASRKRLETFASAAR
ncbi:beta-N-acetylhexosaminidase [Rhodoblastus acidophilus]|uniref:glycoside hydrolase family 3 N-terminal domain-containing protein n=1 Tax=Rhodoblastus acidophilus TaxID=1074 RepID=UPI0022245D2F|nr:glycoside hydrolase family 3 N-terminal domain-containing protein [Rhodoblastus acidophilus]MCW2286194.1 beta-N-acetylhexosaminidase [Rhodoblastus acidophilus]MCW2335124.1 beta-N-acetylhexosaminidase [Rhodoblastus acidophilus]